MSPFMECGHRASGVSNGDWVCAICVGLHPGAKTIDRTPPDLTGRKARCCSEASVRDSNTNLPFFHYVPERAMDSYYCGHSGWD